MKALLCKLVESLEKYCISKGKETHICGNSEDDLNIYMIRYPLFESKYFSVYIHRFLRSDADDHHDHPFNFVSYVVSGGYTEEILKPIFTGTTFDGFNTFHRETFRRNAGDLAHRRAETVHRVIVDQTLSYADRFKAPLTIIFLGPRFREWGFWKLIQKSQIYNVRKFVSWYEYLGKDPDDKKHH